MIRTGDDASRYVDDVLRGKGLSDFKLADNASPVARAAFEDSTELSELRRAVDEFPSDSCEVVGLIDTAAEAAPDFSFPLTLTSEDRTDIALEAESAAVPQDLTSRIINTAVDMAQSTWVEAADGACDIADSF